MSQLYEEEVSAGELTFEMLLNTCENLSGLAHDGFAVKQSHGYYR